LIDIDTINEYIFKGFEIIPLKPLSKKPYQKNWTKRWNKNSSYALFFKDENINLGLKLGSIIDVEGDSEKGNDQIVSLIGDYKHPFYTSNKRSYHHLFLNPYKIRIIKINDIEIRGYGHQSVLPPSIVDNQYEWIDDNNLKVPKVPLKLLSFINNNYNYNFKGKYSWKEQVENTKLNKNMFLKPESVLKMCNCCKEYFPIHKKRFIKEVKAFKKINRSWVCKNCSDVDIRKLAKLESV
jgi:hypothetical protein